MMQENQTTEKKVRRQASKRKAVLPEKYDPSTLLQFGGYIFPISEVARVEDHIRELFDEEEQIGWTFFVVLKNGDILMWEIDSRDYEGQEALMNLHTQLKNYTEALRIATIQIVWGRDAMIVRPEDLVYGNA
jgi:hypothetical protein